MQEKHHDTFLVSFGRRRGRKLKNSQSALMESLLPKLLIQLPEDKCELASLFANPTQPLWFEIGFGAGEHLIEQARRNPNINFIGCEPYINGMARLLVSIDELKLSNVRLYDGDARHLLEKLPDNIIERLFILFPDPWPKVRHHKRRIVAEDSLTLFYQKVKKGGLLRIATDHVDYCTWILEKLIEFGKFSWVAKKHGDWDTAPADWVETRYQAKALEEGRKATFLDYKKPAL